jgi:mono/diheme cytochrome c family protein
VVTPAIIAILAAACRSAVIMRTGSISIFVMAVSIFGGAISGFGASTTRAAASGDYTTSQAAAGAQVYQQHCIQCHGASLQGNAGPALSGQAFAASLRFGKLTAQQLFDFIKTQMPADAPGSLTDQQYLDAMAFILSRNGYPAGSTLLNESTLGSVRLLPYPGPGGSHQQSGSDQQSSSK